MIKLLYDCELRAPACVLLQAAGGGDVAALSKLFDAQYWLLVPTPGMKLMAADEARWNQVVEITKEAWRGKNPNAPQQKREGR